ncbi:hypothetical protein [Amycolatopsis sp. H20-H5]|uniref:hypothetical protein n=1 Tax=Amycolatopsis sp. H20-H5 TaxID=3046309 RepID=UPI002DBFF451|nr:hypothetical protein [Amycolatopsis sp. H20-H5]MEC3977910.1 hypothetical protein [Amycolatopsis sp. H20-H5]
MAERDSWAVMNGATRVVDAEDTRVGTGALWTPGATTGAARTGVVPGPNDGGKVAATAPTPGGTVTVQPFPAVVNASRGLGPYVATLDSVKSVPILDIPADPSNQRNDLIVAQQSDTYYNDATTSYVVRRVRGTAGQNPLDPPVTGSPDYVVLARVRVTAGAQQITDSMIDDLRPGWTVAVGGIIPVTGRVQRDAIPNPFPGMSVYRRDKNWIETRSLTAWRTPDLVKTSALADITDPLTGQLALLTADNMLYRWSGSVWVITANLSGTTPGGDWELSADKQIDRPTLIDNMNVVNTPPVGITHLNGVFTIQTPGWWIVTFSVRFSSPAADKYAFIAGTSPTNVLAKDSTNGTANTQAALTKKFQSNAQFRCYAWSGTSSLAVHESPDDDITGVSAVWVGP